MSIPFNGYPSWNSWNVSLWISNTESIYFNVVNLVKKHGIKKATNILHEELPEKTPDGAIYSKLCIKLAIEGLELD